MCGIAGIVGADWRLEQLESMVESQRHRGPDARSLFRDRSGKAGLGHNRLSIIDLSPSGLQPMSSHDGTLRVVFNGEIYNYLELRADLGDYPFRGRTDTEVILAAYQRWGEECLDRFIGMFSFLLWDQRRERLFAARDRFGVKPLYYHQRGDGTLYLASEIKAIHAAGIPARLDGSSWATYFAQGVHEHTEKTFWEGIQSVPPGHCLVWEGGKSGLRRWYHLPERVGADFDDRSDEVVGEEYLALLTESVRLRFRADVPVGINLSGGLDSSLLLGLVQRVQGEESDVKAFTFSTGDPQYDEIPWVRQMLDRTRHPSVICELSAAEVPALAASVQSYQDEPFGGLPTLAYARIFEDARQQGIIVLLDGQGMDEQWAGYDYYASAAETSAPVVQGARTKPTWPECLQPEFRALAGAWESPAAFPDALRNLQFRDTRYIKIPRALRFNDRISMRASTELREPFLDHRLFELAFRQPPDRKLRGGTGKWLPRQLAKGLLPRGVSEAPKRPVQTPQREWLRGPLREWAVDLVEEALTVSADNWFDPASVRHRLHQYLDGVGDNSYFIWQWLSLGLICRTRRITSI